MEDLTLKAMLIIYSVGYALAAIGVYITDRTIYKKYDRTSLSMTLIISIGSYIMILLFIISAILYSDTYKKIDSLWKYGEYEL